MKYMLMLYIDEKGMTSSAEPAQAEPQPASPQV